MIYYDREGNEISEQKCMELHSKASYRIVRRDVVRGQWHGKEDNVAVVITIWTGGFEVSITFGELDGPPFLFETTAFARHDDRTRGMRLTDDEHAYFSANDEIGVRFYRDEKTAMVGHVEMLAETNQYLLHRKRLNRSLS